MRVEKPRSPLHALITRPPADSEKVAATLGKEGIACMAEPMFHIRACMDAKKEWLKIAEEPIQALLFTSANAVHAFAGHYSKRRGILVLTVGDNTANTALTYGFDHVIAAEGDVDSLEALVKKECTAKGGRIVYARGAVTIGNLTETLQKKGFSVTELVVYDAVPVAELSIPVQTALLQQTIDVALFYSPRSAILFENLVSDASLTRHTKPMHAFCMSKQVADCFKNLKWKKVHVAQEPTNASLIELVTQFQQTMAQSTHSPVKG
ncbi:MAG: hemD [Rickettsiales bacterium]|jgi:uroporphyrinogen-III synthase|nr:hemD [Rickettsiales bacterium]